MNPIYKKAFAEWGYVPLLKLKDDFEELEMFEECQKIEEVLKHYISLGVEIPLDNGRLVCSQEILDDWCFDMEELFKGRISSSILSRMLEARCLSILTELHRAEDIVYTN